MLLPNELKTIIAEYAIRCEICFGHIIQNGRCQGCQMDKHPKKYYITWQSILEKENIHLKLYEDREVEYCNFQGEGLERQTLFDVDDYDIDMEKEIVYCEDTTFLVAEQLIDLQDEHRQWFLLSDCVDHNPCPRHENNFLAIVLYKDEWRFLTHYEASFIFGSYYYCQSFAIHYVHEAQFHHFRKKRKRKNKTPVGALLSEPPGVGRQPLRGLARRLHRL